MRKLVWKSLLDADMNARYWKALSLKYLKRDKCLKIFLAIMASGTVASWGIWENVVILWKTLSSTSALVAIALPILNYPKQIEIMADLGGKWSELRIKYELHWEKVRQNTSSVQDADLEQFKREQAVLEKEEAKLPEDKKLLTRCQQAVLKTRGLDK